MGDFPIKGMYPWSSHLSYEVYAFTSGILYLCIDVLNPGSNFLKQFSVTAQEQLIGTVKTRSYLMVMYYPPREADVVKRLVILWNPYRGGSSIFHPKRTEICYGWLSNKKGCTHDLHTFLTKYMLLLVNTLPMHTCVESWFKLSETI